MNKEQIFEAIGDIDEQYIHEAQVAVKRKTRPVWVKWGAVAASVCLACVGGVIAYNISENLAPEWVGDHYGSYPVTMSRVAWTDEQVVFDGALNKDKLNKGGEKHFAVYVMDTMQDFAAFTTEYGEIFSMEQSYNDSLSFMDTIKKAQYQEGFFAEHSLLVVYVDTNADTKVEVDEVKTEGDSFCVYVNEKGGAENTESKAGWFITVAFTDEEIAAYTAFDALSTK